MYNNWEKKKRKEKDKSALCFLFGWVLKAKECYAAEEFTVSSGRGPL